jgi:hypothetical protein
VPDYGMQTRACFSTRGASLRRASDAHQQLAVAPRASTTSPPNSLRYLAETRYKEWVCCLHFARVLLAPSFYKHNILQSGGRTHAHDMVSKIPCGFIAEQCSVLASFSITTLFIAKVRPRVAGKSDDTVATWSKGPADMCTIKGNDFTSISRRLCR